jgi:hypothetical protein
LFFASSAEKEEEEEERRRKLSAMATTDVDKAPSLLPLPPFAAQQAAEAGAPARESAGATDALDADALDADAAAGDPVKVEAEDVAIAVVGTEDHGTGAGASRSFSLPASSSSSPPPPPPPFPASVALSVKVLLRALSYVSRDLPLPESVLEAVSSISQSDEKSSLPLLPLDQSLQIQAQSQSQAQVSSPSQVSSSLLFSFFFSFVLLQERIRSILEEQAELVIFSSVFHYRSSFLRSLPGMDLISVFFLDQKESHAFHFFLVQNLGNFLQSLSKMQFF